MVLLLSFAFLAGLATILSPCILPVLPLILSSSVGGRADKTRPYGVILGFVASFTFFTLFLATLVNATGVSPDFLRLISVVVIFTFGLSLLLPRFQAMLELLFARLSALVPQFGSKKSGFGGGMLIGMSLGLLWTPCVGPILASVISLAITGSVTWTTFLITLIYSLGTALPMLLIIKGGQHTLARVPWLLKNTLLIQKGFGVVMMGTALLIATGVDRKFQTWVLETFPNYGVGLTRLEDVVSVRQELEKLYRPGSVIDEDLLAKPMNQVIPQGPRAPELITGGKWLNSQPLTLEALKGKVVLVDFWTYSCINCQRTLPYLKAWWENYKDEGLVIIGVHSPEFAFEREVGNVEQAITDFGITYPVMQDNDFATWRAYKNRYWPAKYLIDKKGIIRYSHFGEGKYEETETKVRELLGESDGENLPPMTSNLPYTIYSRTPELYLGFNRIEFVDSVQTPRLNEKLHYSLASTQPQKHHFGFVGEWEVSEEFAKPSAGSSLQLTFEAKEVFLVMRPTDEKSQVRIRLDGQESAEVWGDGVVDGIVTVSTDSLYKLIKLPEVGEHHLFLEFLDGNIEVYAFTFG